jgi:3-oxoacyl-[acyl-carrier protein] reductase
MSKLSGKVAVVTGASKGIGAQIAKELAAAGAAVVVNYASSKQGAEKVVKEITAQGGKAVAVGGDVTKATDVKKLFEEAKNAYGRIDILVNNAGVYRFAPLEAATEEEFHRQFNINVLGLIMATREAVQHFGSNGGSVINISSAATLLNMPMSAIYTATKAAVESVTRVLAKELASKNIRVNAIRPGAVETEGIEALGIKGSDMEKEAVAQTPLGRYGQPSDIAPVAVFLASNDSAWVTGDIVTASGGLGI